MKFSINPQTGWVRQCKHVKSAHFNSRPENTAVSLLVIHCISLPPGQYGNGDIEKFFTGHLPLDKHPYYQKIAPLKVSSHFLIMRCGGVTQFVSTHDRAWHAGQSSFENIDNCNDYSIGIELEGCETSHYEPEQYHSLIELSKCLKKHYSAISAKRIVGHCDIAPQRKLDPGPYFDWNYYRLSL